MIGKGGMGAVYEAIQEPIERRVAIKILHGRYAQEPEIAQRFFNEARAVNIVDHPGIVQISDYGQLPAGVAYLVMEFLKGDTLGQRLKANGGRLALPECVRISRQIAAAKPDKITPVEKALRDSLSRERNLGNALPWFLPSLLIQTVT
jgi:serine/threonine protein kinase